MQRAIRRLLMPSTISLVTSAVLLLPGSTHAEFFVQGTLHAGDLIKYSAGSVRTLDFAKGKSQVFDNGDLHVVTDDTLYLQGSTVSVSNRLDVTGDLVANYPIYAKGNLLKFGGGAPTIIDFNQNGSRIWNSNGALHASTSGVFYIQAPTLSLSRDIDVTNNGRVRNNLQVDGNLTVNGTLNPAVVTPATLTVSGNGTVGGTLGVAGNLAVNTDKFTVTASSGNTAVAGTLAVTGASTLTGATSIAGNLAVNTDKFTVAASSGNSVIGGTLDVTGTSTLSGNVALGTSTSNTVSVNGVINTAVILGTGANKTIKVGDDSTADASTGKSLTISASNRTAGTGNGGNLILNAGSSSGGTAGTITLGTTGSAVTLTPATTVSGLLTMNGGATVSAGAGEKLAVNAAAAPTGNLLAITNTGQASVTNSISGLDVDFSASNATNNSAINISPHFTGGATDGLVYHGINISDGAPTNAAGTDVYVGLNLADLTDPGSGILSTGLYFGSGWDATIAIKNATSFVIADDGGNAMLTVADGGSTGNLTATGNFTSTGKLILGRQTMTLTTSGAGTENLTPTASYVEVTGVDDAADVVQLQSSGATEGQVVYITNLDGTATAIDSTASVKLDGGADVSLTQYDVIQLIFDGTNWLQVAKVSANS